MLRRLPLLLALAAAPVLAQDEDLGGERAPTDLDGVGRITVLAGYRLTSNGTLNDAWYGAKGPGNGLERASDSTGAPFGVATFAYAMSDLVEVGIDLFGSAQNLRLSEPVDGGAVSRKVSTTSYGALIGLRFQGVLDIGPQGLVPFAGLLTGPTVISSKREGSALQEKVTQAWVGSLGATLRLSAKWGLTAEYRFTFLRGPVESPDAAKWAGPFSFSHGGSGFALGVTYAFPPDPSRPVSHF
ncbi:hypothetical protein KH5H1_31210 [Corallococcus caeni]|uniref:Outer membrane protein beta-barrel domain-containing protein n=1 Tax=Corallococcus exercitus TaxID=2316736 RepID=A0A7Y4JQQ3_9BACT|nr:hypothetical protein [Corallococcus exercitus]NOK09421.1 hypothetical protein [Corallococcus exercitus]GMT99002.1 hypothetical protein KH5H1_31210 [Corallococcus sp. KH5-1]